MNTSRNKVRFSIVLVMAAAAGCSDSSPPSGGPDATTEDADVAPDVGPDAEMRDAGELDTGGDIDAGGLDAGEIDAGMMTFPTLADYRTCRSDTDCPVGLGGCVTRLALNREDINGLSSVTLSDLYDALEPGEGVCSRNCTLDISACEVLVLRDAAGDPVPFSCQVVATGTTSYPNWNPPFPFDDRLDFAEQARGRPFAAMCRPPFNLDLAYSPDFCAPCDVNTACDGVCYRFDAQAVVTSTGAPGACLSRAPVDGCPIGFEARDVDGQGAVCVPQAETCGPCQDRDGDGHGAGHCAAVEIDCDDTNPAAYYSVAAPEHAFPTYCGGFDYNCNGQSDDREQIGVAAYFPYHCEFCGDDADGRTVLSGSVAEATLECVGAVVRTSTCAGANRVHCTGDVRQVGCETVPGPGSLTYFRDADGDTYGTAERPQLGCLTGPPSGFVARAGDCNDGDIAINPDARDICECWGDCNQPSSRIDNNCNGAFDEDVTNYAWGLDADGDGATGTSTRADLYCGAPFLNAVLTSASPDCDDTRAVVFAAHARITDASGALLALPVNNAPPRDVNGELYTLGVPAFAEVCDTFDNDCANGADDATAPGRVAFYRDADGDGFGDPNVTQLACFPSGTGGYVADNTDCDDTRIAVNRMGSEGTVFDCLDNNCNGTADEGISTACAVPGQAGACAASNFTCTAGGPVCTQVVFPEVFDDPRTATDEECDGFARPVSDRIYVAELTGGSDAANGTAGNPMETVAGAVSRAVATGRTLIVLQAGTHLVPGGLQLFNGIDIVGGWDGSNASPTGIGTSPSTLRSVGRHASDLHVTGVFAASQAALGTLDHVTIDVDRNPTPAPESSYYGIRLFNSGGLHIQNVTINVDPGVAGAAGGGSVAGAAGVPALADTTPGGFLFCFGTNVSGGNGMVWNVSVPTPGFGPNGSGGAAGLGPPTPPDGTAGFNGLGGTGGTGATVGPRGIISGIWYGDLLGGYAAAGASGGGGGGGWRFFGQGNIWRNGGGGGSGGCGGGFGPNGRPGGSSIGILAHNSTVVFGTSLSISPSGGGAGGVGSPGGRGGASGAGSPTRGGFYHGGGNGGAGGGGGGGRGGNGGISVGILTTGTPNLCTAPGIPTITLVGSPSVGGFGGAPGLSGGAGALQGAWGATGVAGFEAQCRNW